MKSCDTVKHSLDIRKKEMSRINVKYIRPQTAWKKLNAAYETGQPIYIYGAAGYGKTELIRRFHGKKTYKYIFFADNAVSAFGEYTPAFVLIERLRYYAEKADRKYISMEPGILTAVLKKRTGAVRQEDFSPKPKERRYAILHILKGKLRSFRIFPNPILRYFVCRLTAAP